MGRASKNSVVEEITGFCEKIENAKVAFSHAEFDSIVGLIESKLNN